MTLFFVFFRWHSKYSQFNAHENIIEGNRERKLHGQEPGVILDKLKSLTKLFRRHLFPHTHHVWKQNAKGFGFSKSNKYHSLKTRPLPSSLNPLAQRFSIQDLLFDPPKTLREIKALKTAFLLQLLPHSSK